jgi:hypothetical protein
MKGRIQTKNSKTKKNKLSSSELNNAPVSYYSKNFKGTKLIPRTNIINYMFSGFNDFIKNNNPDDYTLVLDDFFIINNNDLPNGLKSNSINLNLSMNPTMSLDKLIVYSFYLKQSSIFKNTFDNFLDSIKYQIGKDVKRTDIYLNGNQITKDYGNIENNYQVADMFYQVVIDNLYQINRKSINLNTANKFSLLSCQNMFNFITELMTLKFNNMMDPEKNIIYKANKHINLVINETEISMELVFDSKLLITVNGDIDPEHPRGNLSFNLYIDLKNNSFELRNFKLDYNINTNSTQTQSQTQSKVPTKFQSFKNNFNTKYIVPAVLVTGGIIATPFILGALGGRKTKKFYKKNRTKKLRKNKTKIKKVKQHNFK